jgi:hypothetical protein
VVGAEDPCGRVLGFLDRRRYYSYFFRVAPRLCSRGSVEPVPNSLLLGGSGGAGGRARASGSVAGALSARPQGGLDFLPMLLNLRPH